MKGFTADDFCQIVSSNILNKNCDIRLTKDREVVIYTGFYVWSDGSLHDYEEESPTVYFRPAVNDND
jgi:hypothetical protein